jgi:hypothetical protein
MFTLIFLALTATGALLKAISGPDTGYKDNNYKE